MKILIIEDKDMQVSLERALQDKDMQTGSPNELGQQVREIAPDVILMDKHISIGLFTFQPNSMILEGNGSLAGGGGTLTIKITHTTETT